MNIIYGGSFNPPTKAHKEIIDKLKSKFNPENIIIIPTGDSYTWKEVISFKDRYNMACIAFKDEIVLDIEQENVYKGTLNTLRYLSKSYKDLYFVMGADNLIQIKKWINYEDLLKEFNFIVLKRNDIDIESFLDKELKEFKNKFKFIDFKNDLSSSLFRTSKDKNIVDSNVYEYIKINKLYEV